MGSAAGRKFLAPPYYSQSAVFASPPNAFLIMLHNGRIIRLSVCVTVYPSQRTLCKDQNSNFRTDLNDQIFTVYMTRDKHQVIRF